MYTIIGICIGLLLYHFIYKPIKVKKDRDWCISHGLVPKEKTSKRCSYCTHDCDKCMWFDLEGG